MTSKFDYIIFDTPYFRKDTPMGFSLGIELKTESLDFARTQQIDPKHYEDFGKDVLNSCFGRWALEDISISRGIYIWEKKGYGLLNAINIPGQETYLELDKAGKDLWRFSCHNIDDVRQHSALSILMNYWLMQMKLCEKT